MARIQANGVPTVNAFERALGALFPSYALSRAQARMAWQMLVQHEGRLQRRGYDAGKTGRRAGTWSAGGGSANAEVTPTLSRVRNRSREMVRNNGYAKKAINTLVARSIGTGILSVPPAPVQPAWAEFVETCDYEGQMDLYGLQSLISRTAFEAGECIVRRIRTRDLRVPLQLQVLEPDYLDDAKFGPVGNGNFAVAGVEIDRTGRRVAYWLYDAHPGEVGYLPKSFTSKRVEASEVIFHYEKERPGQLRAMPRMAVSMMRLHDVDEYQDAVMMLKKIAACFAAFVTQPAGTQRTVVESTTDPATGRREEQLAPGMIWYGNPGEDVKFGSLGAIARDDYTNDQLHAIAAGIGVTYEQMTGDHSQVTYLSGRSAQLDFRALVETYQWVHFIPTVCRGIERWFVDAAYTAGRVRADRYTFEHTPPRFPMVDPLKDTQADKEEVLAGFSSRAEKIRLRGEDPAVVRKEIETEREEDRKKGLVFDTDAVHDVSAKPAAPAGDEPTPAPKKKDDAKAE